RLPRGHRLQFRLARVIALLLLVEITTLSRSGLAGLLVGGLILAIPYRHKLRSEAVMAPLGAVAPVLGVFAIPNFTFFERVLRSRTQTGHADTHFSVYGFIGPVLHMHPLLGLGLNNFAVYYEQITGKKNWGPHSFYVSVIVESGIIGTTLFALLILFL